MEALKETEGQEFIAEELERYLSAPDQIDVGHKKFKSDEEIAKLLDNGMSIGCMFVAYDHHHHHLRLTSVVHAWTVSSYEIPPPNSIQSPFSMQIQFNQVL